MCPPRPAARHHAHEIDSQLHRLRANAAAEEGNEANAVDAFALALANARNLGFAFYLAPVLRDYGTWLRATGRAEEATPLLTEARELFARMGAVTWLERVDALVPIAAGEKRPLADLDSPRA